MVKLLTSCEAVVFCSSAGQCQLDCEYCIVNPIAKHEPSLVIDDFAFLLESLGKSTFLILSGKGDFFAGYPGRDRLLERILDFDVEIALDINGVFIHEFGELTQPKLGRVRGINLTMHFAQLKGKGLLGRWAANALTILNLYHGEMILGTICSPIHSDLWEESLVFYKEEVFAATGRKLWLIRDCMRPLDEALEHRLDELEAQFAEMIDHVHQEDFAAAFAGHTHVLCPAGNDYFRVWNDGTVVGCPYIPELASCGNLKDRVFNRRPRHFRCSTPRYCDCNDIHSLGKMVFDKPD